MTSPRDPAHYLRAVKTTRTPQRLLWLDCAATPAKERGTFVERWQCGTLGTTHYTSRKGERKDTLNTYDDSGELWIAAGVFATKNRRTTLFAYDLAYQLRVSEALIHLPALDWNLDKIVLEKTSAWALFRKDTASIMLCDLKSWCPVDFSRIAADILKGGDRTQQVEAGENYLHGVTRYHVGIIRDAALQLIDWIETEELGPFRPTGSGQSYSAYRRRFLRHKLLVHDDMERLAAERAAMHTGRCEAWRHGALKDGPYVEYDMTAAYCRIAAECAVPAVALGGMAGNSPSQLERAMEHYAVLADVTITTDVPVVPLRLAGRTVWPVGTFRTMLWDPEIRLAMDYAKDFQCHRAYRYTRERALSEFARYVLDGLDAGGEHVPPIARRVLKHWSRCLVGRLGLRFRAWQDFGDQDPPDLRLVTFVDTDDGTFTDMLIAGNKRMILAEMTESTDSLPQIPGWVMSECRRRLWAAMVAVGLEHVAYVDTDSLIVDNVRVPFVLPDLETGEPAPWSVKGKYSRMTIHGPRNLQLETVRRVSGLPLTARQTAPLEFTGQIMRSLKESMRGGDLSCVATIPRKFVLDAPDLRRQHLRGGQTAPYEVKQTTTTEDYY